MFLKSILDDTPEEELNHPADVDELSVEHWPEIMRFFEIYEQNPTDNLPPQPLESKFLQDYYDEVFVDYIDSKPLEEVYELLCDANYLDFKFFTHLCACKVAKDMKGKTIDELRTLFDIEDEFTEEDKREIEKETKLAEEFQI